MEVVRAYKAGNSVAFIIPAHLARQLGIKPKTQLAVIHTTEDTLEIALAERAINTVKFRRHEK